MRIRTLCPAKLEMFTDAVPQAPARLTAEPGWGRTTLGALPTTLPRKKLALVALLRWARYQEKLSVNVPVPVSVINGDWIEVVPPSTSNSPADAPAAAPVTRSL